jgi:3',5'-cyclic AMP phosphodiesterase CpdA
MTAHWSLLFVTDLHYQLPDANFTDDPKELYLPALRENVFTDFDNILTNGFGAPRFDVIAIGGDITTNGQLEGFERFTREAMPLLRPLVQSAEAICLVPGNHDVQWGLDPTEPDSFQTKFAAFQKLVEDSQITTCLLPDGELTDQIDDKLILRRPPHGPIYVDRQHKLIVTCINSAIRCGELNRQLQDAILGAAKGTFPIDAIRKYLIRDVAHVTQAQLNKLSADLVKLQTDLGDDWNSYLRVALLHHHLIHFPDQITEHRGYELLVDSARVLSILQEFDFDMVLTGHKHQPYKEKYVTNDRELLLLGGPTVGGRAAGDSFRGLRSIDVEDHGGYRSFKIADIPYQLGQGNVPLKVGACRTNAPVVDCRRPPEAALKQRSNRIGFFYRELASITEIDEDGDALRVVECEDLTIKDGNSERVSRHVIQLPPTSGYLDHLRAAGRGFKVTVENPIPSRERQKVWGSPLRFTPQISESTPASYMYQWYAVNSFALNKRQFDYMYGRDPGHLDDIEFTHFTPVDPVQELTVVVRFPPGFRLKNPPSLRVAQVDTAITDSRRWEVKTQDDLLKSHALRYYESLNIAALRVKYPDPRLSYGIQWDVPEAPTPDQDESRLIRDLRKEFESTRNDKKKRESLLRILARILIVTRQSLLSGWSGPVDASFMYLDDNGGLPMLIAAVDKKLRTGKFRADELLYTATLRYGDGIAGRAFKANRLRVYVSPGSQSDDDELDYYVPLPGAPMHAVLVSLPVHLPVKTKEFKSNPQVYEAKVPYGVINLGSELAECPLVALRLPEEIPLALRFQHGLNILIYQQLNELFRGE